jgi:hypothetical protein
VIDIEIKDLTTGEIYKETLNVTGTFSTKTFVINYTGNPNHKHNVRAYFTDCCKSINKTTGERGCNSDKGGGVLYSPEYGFDKNMEVLKIIVKNSDGKEIGTQRVTGCASSAPSSPCYDLNFS